MSGLITSFLFLVNGGFFLINSFYFGSLVIHKLWNVSWGAIFLSFFSGCVSLWGLVDTCLLIYHIEYIQNVLTACAPMTFNPDQGGSICWYIEPFKTYWFQTYWSASLFNLVGILVVPLSFLFSMRVCFEIPYKEIFNAIRNNHGSI